MGKFEEYFADVVELSDGNDSNLAITAELTKEQAAERFSEYENQVIGANELREEWLRYGFYGESFEEPRLCWYFGDVEPHSKGAKRAWVWECRYSVPL